MTEKISHDDVVEVLTSLGGVIQAIKRFHSDHEGMDHGSAILLSILFRHGPARPSDVAQLCGLDLSTVSRHARAQEDAGHIAKAADPTDRRAHRLALTDSGIEYVHELWTTRIDRFKSLIGHWSREDALRLGELSRKLGADLGLEQPLAMPDLELVRATHQAALAETLPKGA